jgi:hypothetical protein
MAVRGWTRTRRNAASAPAVFEALCSDGNASGAEAFRRLRHAAVAIVAGPHSAPAVQLQGMLKACGVGRVQRVTAASLADCLAPTAAETVLVSIAAGGEQYEESCRIDERARASRVPVASSGAGHRTSPPRRRSSLPPVRVAMLPLLSPLARRRRLLRAADDWRRSTQDRKAPRSKEAPARSAVASRLRAPEVAGPARVRPVPSPLQNPRWQQHPGSR